MKDSLRLYVFFFSSDAPFDAQLGAMLSCPVAGLGIEKVGRRMTMLLLTLPFLAGWLVIFFAQDVPMIYAGRFITG